MVGLPPLFVHFLGVGGISGNFMLQLLQNTNDLPALRCVTAQVAELPRCDSQDGWVGACLNLHHLDDSGHCGAQLVVVSHRLLVCV